MNDIIQELPLVIPISVLEEFFQCSICLNTVQETMTTPCGHRFCGSCIREWVDRNHHCPCCNSTVLPASLMKDHQFDSLISAVDSEKMKAEDKYFETLISAATLPESELAGRKFSPVEEILKKHLKQSLASHERYFQSLRLECTQHQQKLERELERALQTLMLEGLSPTEVQLQTAELESRLGAQKENLSSQLNKCMQLVADAYDRYLTNHIPSMEILPVKVSVYLPDKKLRIPDVTIKASEEQGQLTQWRSTQFRNVSNISHLQTVIEEEMRRRGDPLLRWGCQGQMVLIGPLTRENVDDLDLVLGEEGMELYPDVYPLTWHSRPVLQYGMKPGSEIIVKGCFKCESDMPKVCFVQTYKEQGPRPVDYFSCKQCGINWVCKSCVQICHQGHNVTTHVLNHKPTWACCYCPKKKMCKLQT